MHSHYSATYLLAWGTLLHLITDWFLQNQWQAFNKQKWRHPAGYVHAALHTLAQIHLFHAECAIVIGIAHFFIDLRTPLIYWRRLIGQTTDPNNPVSLHLAIWQDQVAHITVIAAVALWLTRS